MKKHLLQLSAIILATSLSAFSKFAVTENFLVQTDPNIFMKTAVAPYGCFSPATLFCKYDITNSGKANIPAQSYYTAANIYTYLSNGWVTVTPGTQQRLYGK